MTVAERLHMLRMEKDMTLEQVAKRVNLTRQTMSRYETGAITKIDYDTIVALAEIYNVHPGYIMGWCKRDGSYEALDTERKKLIRKIEKIPDNQLEMYKKVLSLPVERIEAICKLLE